MSLYIVYHKMRLDPNPKLTESNQIWIGSGPDPTKNMVWIRGWAEKNPTGMFWIGFDQVWTRGRDALSAYHRLHVPNYWPWVVSHLRLPHHDSALIRSACIPRY
jgi:hypothetical protein